MGFPPVPTEIKSVAHVLKVADEHDTRNIVVSYWARMYACQFSMKQIPGAKPPEVTKLLIALMDWLETTKKENLDVDGISHETVAQAMIEQYALQLFAFADGQDREGEFNKNMIKAFYTSAILMDILQQFGELSEDLQAKRKYAKWKAAYIHNCLRAGDIPTSGGPNEHLKNVIDTSKAPGEEDSLLVKPRLLKPEDYEGNDDVLPTGPAPASSPVTPVVPQPQPFTPRAESVSTPTAQTGDVNSGAIQKAQKFCKYATSALNYDDVNTAIVNLQKALNLLQTGKE